MNTAPKQMSEIQLMAFLLEAGHSIEEAVSIVTNRNRPPQARDTDLEEEAAAQLSYSTNGGPQ